MAVGSFEKRNDKYLSLGSFGLLSRKAGDSGRGKRRRKQDEYYENGREREVRRGKAISRYLLAISHLLRSGDLSAVSSELPLCRNPRFELFWGLCQEPFLLAASLPLLACSRLLSRFAMFCSMSISICCSSSIISEAAYELQLPSGGLYRISKQTTAYAY